MTLFQIVTTVADTVQEKTVSIVDSMMEQTTPAVLADTAKISGMLPASAGESGLTSAWIGFIGVIVGALIAIIGAFALEWYRRHKKESELKIVFETEESRYLKWVISEHRYLPITGLRTRAAVDVELERVYVSLSVDPRRIAEMGIEGEDKVQHKLLPESFPDILKRDKDKEIAIADALKLIDGTRVCGLVILGGPGTGKTTVLKYLALTCARGMAGERLDQPRPLLPLFISLRDVAAQKEKKSLADYLSNVCNNAGHSVSPDFFVKKLDDGGCMVLLDGLDEVANEDERKKVSKWIQEQCAGRENNLFAVTCRPAGFKEDYLPPRFVRLDVQDFDEKDVAVFARNWCVAVETMTKGDSAEARRIGEEKGADLVKAIEASKRVKDLAVNPLLLSIIALVHRYRARLPNRRVDLYNECVEVLLGHWDEAKDFPVPIPPGKSLQVLRPLALWMHEQKQGEEGDRIAHRDEIIPVIAPHLISIGQMEAEDAGRFLDSIRDRSGLLVGRGGGMFGFQHQTFQEYLAAWEISERGKFDLLAEYFGESYWQEVVLLCAGIRDASALFAALLKLSDKKLTDNWRLLMAVLDEALSVDAATRLALFARPLEILKQATDPHTAVRASLWLRRGKPDFDTLIRGFKEAEGELAKGHFALLLGETGDEQAIEVLKPHLTDDNRHVRYLSALALDMLGFEDQKALDDLLMVRVDAGEFTMGSKEAFGAQTPRKIKTSAYLIDRFPLTNAQYRRFIQAGGYQERKHWSEDGWKWKEQRNVSEPEYINNSRFNVPSAPVVGISWYEAEAYAKWTSKRLLEEEEWERAARGDADAREFPWGDAFDEKRCNTYEGGIDQPSPGGSFPDGVSPHGCYDMIGNVLEWTESLYEKGEPSRVVRGGSWNDNLSGARCASRLRSHPVSGSTTSGCVSPGRLNPLCF